jgi:DNA-binding CsgD family transcriptional regulator/tetratricopeptide (TPR) repeat protein
MATTRKFSFYCCFLLLGILTTQFSSFAQSKEPDVEKWVVELSKKNRGVYDSVFNLMRKLEKADSLQAFIFLDKLAEKGKSKTEHFQALYNCLKSSVIYYHCYYKLYLDNKVVPNQDQIRQQLMRLYSSAIDIAYRSEDDMLVAYVSYTYASVITWFGEVGLCVMYAKNGIDLFEKISYPVAPERYQFLAELLYRVREYKECIKYAKKAVIAWRSSPNEIKQFTVSCMNTVALGYHRQKIYDSAFIYYNQALDYAKQIRDSVWTGIVLGNMGQVFYALGKFDSAYTLLKTDYQISKEKRFFDNAANSLQWAARANLALGNKAAALIEVREAYQLLKLWPDPNYLRNAYYTSTQIFREMGAYDSAFYYNHLYGEINDSLEKVVATSSLAISKARLNDEVSRYNIQSLNKEKRTQLLYRNIIIVSIIALSFVTLLIVNRRRLREKIKKEHAEQEKLFMEQEMVSAKEQLEMFTANMVEKTNLIEKLELQIKDKLASSEQQAIISELSRQTILTEEDWLKFKTLFEKINPGFFIKLQEKVTDITVAELRMAALTRLHLSTNQIASILGISPNSVYKTKQRLRNRLNLENENTVEEVIAKM